MSYISTFFNSACLWKWWSMFHFDIGFVLKTHGQNLALYYLETIEGQQVIVAVAIRAGGNQLVYQPFVDFVQDYWNILPLPHVLMWNYSFQLNAWLDDIVYYSFVSCSNEGITKPWDIILSLRYYSICFIALSTILPSVFMCSLLFKFYILYRINFCKN